MSLSLANTQHTFLRREMIPGKDKISMKKISLLAATVPALSCAPASAQPLMTYSYLDIPHQWNKSSKQSEKIRVSPLRGLRQIVEDRQL